MSITPSSVTTTAAPVPDSDEIACVLIVIQASLSLVAGLGAIPFAIVEPGFRGLSLATILVAAAMFWLARGIRRQQDLARRLTIALEAFGLLATLLLSLLPIELLRGPVPLLVNLVLPGAVLWLLLRPGSDARGAAGGRAAPG